MHFTISVIYQRKFLFGWFLFLPGADYSSVYLTGRSVSANPFVMVDVPLINFHCQLWSTRWLFAGFFRCGSFAFKALNCPLSVLETWTGPDRSSIHNLGLAQMLDGPNFDPRPYA